MQKICQSLVLNKQWTYIYIEKKYIFNMQQRLNSDQYIWSKHARCFRPFLHSTLFFTLNRKTKYGISPLSTSQKIPGIFLTLKIYQFSRHFPDFSIKFLKFLTIPDKLATLVFKGIVKRSRLQQLGILFIWKVIWHTRITTSLKELQILYLTVASLYLPFVLLSCSHSIISINATNFDLKKLVTLNVRNQ